MTHQRKKKAKPSPQEMMVLMYDVVRQLLTTTYSCTQIAAGKMSKTTVSKYQRLLQAKNLTWSAVSGWPPEQLYAELVGTSPAPKPRTPQPDWKEMVERKQATGMSNDDLWQEYRALHPGGMSSKRFAAQMKKHQKVVSPTMKQAFRPGERIEVDYAGTTVPLYDRHSNAVVRAQIFVATSSYSKLTYVEASHSQKSADFLGACVRTLEYFGGAPEVLVTDNLKSAVTKAGKRVWKKDHTKVRPVFQRDYAEFGRHYDVLLQNARPRSPRDKATVEGSVRIVTNIILRRLRTQTFYSLEELNAAIAKLLDVVNTKTMGRYGMSREQRFMQSERAILRALPNTPYEYGEWMMVKSVPRNYHACINHHNYSVPHTLIGRTLQVRITGGTLDVFHEGRLVATHRVSHERGEDTTLAEHQPPHHREWGSRTIDGLKAWARDVGVSTVRWVDAQFARSNPSMGLPACDDLKMLAAKHGTKLVELAACQSFTLRSPTISTVQMLLATPRRPGRVVLAHAARSTRGKKKKAEPTWTRAQQRLRTPGLCRAAQMGGVQ